MIAIRRFLSEDEWIEAVVDDFIDALEDAERSGRRPAFCLAGGSTPAPAYRAVARALAGRPPSPIGPAILVIGDERLRPSEPGQLNETMIRDSFSAAGPAVEILGWDIRSGADAAIRGMAEALGRVAAARGAPAGSPIFDACFLGLGSDGHTAGIFSASPVRTDADPIGGDSYPGLAGAGAIATTAPAEPRERVSLTIGALSSTRRSRFLVRAAGKEDALRRLASGDPTCPAVLCASGDGRAEAFALA
ncbi:MAG: 6-phosphogluconolactonase [Spirochaetes bacterium]|nr:6-phosphogluconolactonase [Spirochaetota bacterium]MBU1081128.1 6-phosphogluconolactonase [Spirochaetota bacterium]